MRAGTIDFQEYRSLAGDPTHDFAVPNFAADLEFGQGREQRFFNLLVGGKIEHKADRLCQEKGNLAVEYEKRDHRGCIHPSGISVSESDWYAIEFAFERWVLLRTYALCDIHLRAIEEGRIAWGGDGERFHCALIPFGWLPRIGVGRWPGPA